MHPPHVVCSPCRRRPRQAIFSSLLAAGIALAPMALLTPADAAFIVAPNSLAGTEGNSANAFPFHPGGSQPNMRYQQVYAASQFSSLGTIGGLITQIIFRPDGTSGSAFMATLPSIRIDLSTTSAGPDALSLTFASNVGANNVTVFGGASGAPLTLSSANTGSGPRAFDIVINLSTPFFYNPSLGNLLLDVRNFGDGNTTFFDSENTAGDSISRVYTLNSGVNSATADTSNTAGLVTGFTIVPEPSTYVLFLSAVLTVLGRRVWQRRAPYAAK